MATQVQNRRGTTAEHSTFTGANGELTVDTTKRTLVVHDGATAGGRPLLREDQSNLPTSAPTTGIYNASGSLAISTGGSGRLFVGPTGQIGISQSSLATGGFTAGTLRIGHSTGQTAGVLLQNTSTAADSSFWYTDGTGSFLGSNNGFFAHLAGGSERLRITSAGLVGVGTSSPQSAVDVLSGVRGVPETSGSTTSVTTLRLRGSSNGVLDIGELSSATAGSYWLQVRDRTDLGYAYNLALQPNGGNVGIGTNAIRGTSLLDARGDISFGSNADYYGLLSYNAGTGHFESTSSDGAFKWIRASGAATSMVLDSSGRLLVGTSSSKTVGAGQYSLLNVQGYVGASNGGGDVTLSRGETAANITTGEVLGLISFTDSAGYAFAQFYCEADEAAGTNDYPGRLVFATTPENQTPSTGPVERMRISQNGLVSIFGPGGGTFLNLFNSGGYSGLHELDNTAYTIGQNSDVRAMRIGSGANWLTTGVNLAPGGTSWGTYSDERLKNDIVELTDCLDNIKGIRCVSYRLTDVDNANSKKRIGVIAQDLVGKYDEAINASRRSENDETEYLSVQYSDLIPVLLKALQEASVKIESLESRLTAAGI